MEFSKRYIKLMAVQGEIDNYIDVFYKHSDEKTKNLIIIGKAGVGKSTYITENFSPFDYIKLAYTRLAATQIKGNTLSSAFKLGMKNDKTVNESINLLRRYDCKFLKRLQCVKGLIIDEFFTTPFHIMEKVNEICKIIRRNNAPLGGLSLVLVGDDRQTESIEKSFVDSDLFKQFIFDKIELQEHPNMRLTYEFMDYCNQFRNPRLNRNKILRLLRDARFSKHPIDSAYNVFYTNKEVNECNEKCLTQFQGKKLFNYLGKDYKDGCPIRITNNCENLCNGMMGILTYKKKSFDEGKEIEPVVNIDGEFYDLDLEKNTFVPGFATTIHVCQSKTWHAINIYISKKELFNNRSTNIRLIYVALTRVRDFNKCYIKFKD